MTTAPTRTLALLALDALALTRLAEQCHAAAAALGTNTAEGKPFADLEAAAWVLLDQRDELLGPALFPNAPRRRANDEVKR